MQLRYNSELLIALGLFAFALIVRVFMLAAYPFDGLYGQDPYAYYDYAVSLRAALSQGQSPPSFFWPLGYPLHVVAASWIVGVQPLAGQLVSLIAGALIAPLTFALAREAMLRIDVQRARQAGVIAGLIVATAGQLMISSLSVMSDTVGLAWATGSAWLTLHYARTLRPGILALASLTLSIAVVTRWASGLLALPWVACILLAWRRNWSSIGWRRAFALSLIAVAVGGVIVGAQLLSGESHTGDLQVVGWDPTNAFRSRVVNSDGAFQYDLPIGLFYLIRPLFHPSFVFPLFAPLWLVGLWSLSRADSPARALLIGWPLVVYGFLAGIAWQSDRFILTLFPALAVWVGLGFAWVGDFRRPALVVFLVVALIGTFVWSLRVVGDFIHRNKNADLARVQHVAALLPPGTRVITFGVTLTLEHYSDLDVTEIYSETLESLPDRVCGPDAEYLYLDVANIERQWSGLAPEVNYRWLRDGPGLEAIDWFEGYTLFEVGNNCS